MTRCRRARAERGQSTVEFALVVPLLFLVVLAAAQVGLVVLVKLSVTHTAREVARAVSIDPSLDPAEIASVASPTGAHVAVDVAWRPSAVEGSMLVEVHVSQQVPAVFGSLVGPIEASATVAMLSEAPP